MRPITILLLIMFFLFIPFSKGENITVELVPSNMEVKVGDTFNLDLVVKNVPEDGKCQGFETKIYYDSSILNLSNIQLSGIGESADDFFTTVEIKPTYGFISLMWSSNPPYGNFKLATISFKALNPGEANITLKSTAISDEGGSAYENISTHPATVTVKSPNNTLGVLTLKNYKINSNIEGILSLITTETPVKNISGSMAFSNISLVGIPVPPDVNIFKNYSYSIENNTLSFFAVPFKEYENKTVFENFLKIPLLINSSIYNITINLTVNGELVENISIKKEVEEKNITTEYSGLIFYVDSDYSEETNISLGYSKKIKLKVYNVDNNLTNFSGYIFINNSLFKVSNYGVPEYSNIYNKINYSNITYNNSYLYFNISLKNGTNGNYSILKFTLSPKTNENISSLIYLGNLSIYENNTEVSLSHKNLTVNIIKRKKNTPPRLKVSIIIEDNKKVYLQALGYDADNETLRYLWDFGDGKNSTLQDPIHIYSNYSEYRISCTVWDNLNESDSVETILPIMDISPLESYSLSNKSIFLNNSKNHTIYLNLSLKNPFEYGIMGYINFVDYYNNYYPSKLQYYVELKPNETKNLLIPINITKYCDIKWNIVYYPLYRDKFLKNAELKYYKWNFKERIETSKHREKPVNESIIYKEHINNYSKVLNVRAPDVIIKIKGIYEKEYVVYRNIVVSEKSIYFYIFASLSGFIIGLVAILAIKKIK